MPWYYWLIIPATYVLASISFAWLAGRIKGIDLKKQGSGNLGATNAGRVLGKEWFFLVFSLDLAKGLGPVLLAQHLDASQVIAVNDTMVSQASGWLVLCTGLAAILGHTFTCFHGFKGGKAVATSLGVLIALVWVVALVCFVVWFLCWVLFVAVFGKKFAEAVGPASVLAALAAPIAQLYSCPSPGPWAMPYVLITLFIIIISGLIIIRHRSNIVKMLQPSAH